MHSANSLVLLAGVLNLVVNGQTGINHNAQPISIAYGMNGSIGPDGMVAECSNRSESCDKRLTKYARSVVDDLPSR